MNAPPVLQWTENDTPHSARWQTEANVAPPARVVIADDRMAADQAYRLVCEGTALLWRGDFQNARNLLQALARRIDRPPRRPKAPPPTLRDAFNRHRMAQAQRARTLGLLLIPVEPEHRIPLRRAPDVHQACLQAHGPADAAYVISLRELQGIIGAHEWRKKGVPIAALGTTIHPHYGVFSPVRGEYLDLVAQAPLPTNTLAFDIGTGTGVLAAILARRGVARVIGTDQNPRALACAAENIERLGLNAQVELQQTDLFPVGRAPLIVCNPPWLPARPVTLLEQAIYDPDNCMLLGFLNGLPSHLEPGGEGWLILSDLAEHLGLRHPEMVRDVIAAAGLRVIERLDTRPKHPKVRDMDDPLHAARALEVTSMWRLTHA
jgi:methylase of polypeptide subunit release factors